MKMSEMQLHILSGVLRLFSLTRLVKSILEFL